MNKKGLVLLFLLVTACLAKDYSYTSMDIKATVLPDSTVKVSETWVMDFSGHFTEGYRYFYTDKMRVSDFTVSSDGRRLPSRQTSGGSKTEFTWDIDVTDSSQTYVMDYTVRRGIQSGDKSDVVYYTVVFSDREKPVGHVNFEIAFPQDIDLSTIPWRATAGTLTQTGPRTLSLVYDDLPPYTPLDLEIQLPKGIVEIPFDWVGLVLSIVVLLINIVGYAVIASLIVWSVWHMYSEWSNHGRDPPVVHKSEMLANLKPAIAGLIIDEAAGIDEIIATIIDLCVRGYIQIRQTDSRFGLAHDQELTLLKSDLSGLEEYEVQLVKDLFEGKDKVTTSELDNKFYTCIPGLTDKINRAGYQAGLFDDDPALVREKYQTDFASRPILALVLYILMFFFSIFSMSLTMDSPLSIFIVILSSLMAPSGFFLVILIIISVALARFMVRKSERGVEMQGKYQELQTWMSTYPLKEQRLFDEFLPYAIAFGIGDVWIKKMEKLGNIQRSWYQGTLTSSSFNSFHSSMSRSLSSSPSGHGGGGGGFGGGGGMGGGGGGFR